MLVSKLSIIWAVLNISGALALPGPSPAIASQTAVATPPSQDPFYTAPAGFKKAKVGTILRSRPPPTPLSFLGVDNLNITAAYQLQYRTTDNDGNPAVAITTLIIPRNPDYTKLLAYQVAIDASCVDCAPSYTLQQRADPKTGISQGEFVTIDSALDRGWCITAADFEETNAAWLARKLTAYAILDAIRATLSSTALSHILPNPTITLWGYSGGGIATGAAAELQPSYAPELKIAGAVLGGPSPNIGNVLANINLGVFSGTSVGGIWGLANAYPAFAAFIEQHLVPATAATFKYARSNYCLLTDLTNFAFQNITAYFDEDILKDPYVIQLFAQNNMGVLAPPPSMPIYVYQAINNELSPVKDTDDLVAKYCAAGSNVKYDRDLLSEHISLVNTGGPAAILWLQDRFDGVPMTPGCTTANVASTLASPEALAVYGSDNVQFLLALAGAPIGPASLA